MNHDTSHFRAVFFDFDGTLADSYDAIAASVNYIRGLRGHEPLTTAEKELIKSHVASSLEILYAQAKLPDELLVTVSRHHERWDGSGYPRGLELKQLGLAAEMA